MARIRATAGLFAYVALTASMLAHAAPARRQLGNLECNIDRAEIIFHVAQLAATANHLGNATGLVSANSTADADVQTAQAGAQGAGDAIKVILLGLINGDAAPDEVRQQVGGNLTLVRDALADLSSTHNATSALLGAAEDSLTNAELAATGVVTNCK